MTTRARAGGLAITDAMRDVALFGRHFSGVTWAGWETFLRALFALPMSDEQAALYRRCTGRSSLPTSPAREGWIVAGRRAGKSRMSALVAVWLACFHDWQAHLAPGEVGTVMLLAADRKQARVLMRYIVGLLESVPMLNALIANRSAESIELSNRVVIEIATASFRSTRGYTIIAAICDEIAYWRSEDSANPDAEIIAAIRPGMASIPGSLLLAISSPHARRGELWSVYRRHYGKDGDPVLVWQAASNVMNPSLDERVIADAYERDDAVARAEYGAQFRSDLEDFVSRETLDAVVVTGRRELGHSPRYRYTGFVDPSGGSSDSMTLAIAHAEPDKVILDLVREVHPPFSPDVVVADFASVLKRYGLTRVTGDAYTGTWCADAFRRHGIVYSVSERPKSAIYRDVLPLLTGHKVELLDHPRLISQLLALERRVSWGGRESIDHPPGQHDDVANAVSGALTLAHATRRPLVRPRMVFDLPEVTIEHPTAQLPTPVGVVKQEF